MADSDGAFLNSLYRDHGIRGFHDGISYHPYTEGHDPDLPCSPGRPSVAQP
jgi:hypothetical protein